MAEGKYGPSAASAASGDRGIERLGAGEDAVEAVGLLLLLAGPAETIVRLLLRRDGG